MAVRPISLDDVDIIEVAKRLGLQTARAGKDDRVLALCPFHAESTPSFTLFRKSASTWPHFHCFGCQEHGGVLDLIVKTGKATDYGGAILWLQEAGLVDRDSDRRRIDKLRKVDEAGAIQNLLNRAKDHNNNVLLKSFADDRSFSEKTLIAAGILAVDLGNVLRHVDVNDEIARMLVTLGVARRSDQNVFGQGVGKPSLIPFASEQRIIIPIQDPDGRHVGLLARASRDGQEPKYKFPAGFERSRYLYGLHHVTAQIRASDQDDVVSNAFVDLYVVEGVFDALRLREIGHFGVAAFGTSITKSQIDLIENIAKIAGDKGRTLRLHVFFDMDDAGRKGTARALPRLMASAAKIGYLVDVVRPEFDENSKKQDPDSWIRQRQAVDADVDLDSITWPALNALVADFLGDIVPIEQIGSHWAGLSWPERFTVGQRFARRLRDIDYDSISERIHPEWTSLGVSASETGSPSSAMARDLLSLIAPSRREQRDPKAQRAQHQTIHPSDENRPLQARLLEAMELAKEASNNREYPVDVGSWERLQKAALIFAPLLAARLKETGRPLRPFTAHYIPRSNGAPRLKCGPCPEDAVLQQLVLVDLLSPHNDPGLVEKIPAVRWWPGSRELTTTGRGDSKLGDAETVSFAYQIDMSALDGRPDRRSSRRDIFRPFIECWNAYIAYASRRISRMPGPVIHVARLDIRRFYDEIPRRVIERKLMGALRGIYAKFGPAVCPELVDVESASDKQAARLTDWILRQSFGDPSDGYTYVDPIDGEVKKFGKRGQGLPQGPPLSAYLATIALFDLDERMVGEIGHLDRKARLADGRGETDKGRFGGLYVRYVDDIILAAPTEVELRHLLDCVVEEVRRAGLRLNEKSEVLLPKTIAEAREWLVDRRGAGFSDYGVSDELPAPVNETTSGWGDIPDLDRRHALALLLDATLEDPQTFETDTVFERLRQVVQSGDSLRDTDLGHVARRVLMRISLDWVGSNGDALGPDLSLEIFKEYLLGMARELAVVWHEKLGLKPDSIPQELDGDSVAHEALHRSRPILTIFDGIERVLMSRPEMNPQYSPESQIKLAKARLLLISAVRNGFLNFIYETLVKSAEERKKLLKFQLTQHQIFLEDRADIEWKYVCEREEWQYVDCRLRLPRKLIARSIPGVDMERLPAAWRFVAGWKANFSSEPALDCAEHLNQLRSLTNVGSDWRAEFPFSILHASIAMLEGVNRSTGAGQSQAILNSFQQVNDDAATTLPAGFLSEDDPGKLISRILKIWFGEADGEELSHVDNIDKIAAYSFWLILSNSPAINDILLTKRPIVKLIAGGAGALIIPQPSLENLPGLLFCRGDQIIAVRLIIRSEAKDDAFEQCLPSRLDWKRIESGDIQKEYDVDIVRFEASIPGDFQFLLSADNKKIGNTLLSWEIPALFRALVRRVASDHDRLDTLTPLTNPYSILFRKIGEEAERDFEVEVVSWRINRNEVQGLAFPRDGRVLISQRTPGSGADHGRSGGGGDWIWRIGVAIADVLGAASAATGRSEDPEMEEAPLWHNRDRLSAALTRKVLSRIRGAHLSPTGSASDLHRGVLPRSVERALHALADLRSDHGEGLMPSTVFHFIEGRAMVVRRSMPAALETVPGGPATMLAKIGYAALGSSDEFYGLRLDGEASGDFSRSVKAYLHVADVLADAARRASGELAVGLRLASIGTQLWAMTIAWREFALALLARLDPPSRQEVLGSEPVLAAWGLDSAAHLIDPRFGLSEADSHDFGIELQSKELMQTLRLASSANRLSDAWQALDRVTLLGWFVVAGMTTALLPIEVVDGNSRPAISMPPDSARDSALIQEAATSIARIMFVTAETEQAVVDWPLDFLVDTVQPDPVGEVLAALRSLAQSCRIRWRECLPAGKVILGLDSQEGRFVYNPPNATAPYRPAHWQLILTGIRREKKQRGEVALNAQHQELQIWTVVEDADSKQPLILSVASEQLSRHTGLNDGGQATSVAHAIDGPDDLSAEGANEPRSTAHNEEGDSQLRATEQGERGSAQAPSSSEGANPPPSEPPQGETASRHPEPNKKSHSDWRNWREVQRSAWKGRRLDPESALDRCYFRFAFLQIDFAEGYEDPKPAKDAITIVFDSGKSEVISPTALVWPSQKEGDGDGPNSNLASSGKVVLCRDEWRRRQILKEVLETCKAFGVNVLLLPEYSVRAETVFWLARHAQDNCPGLSIWAGTFRVPSFMDVLVDPERMVGRYVAAGLSPPKGDPIWKSLEAVLPVIFQDSLANAQPGPPINDRQPNSEASMFTHVMPSRLAWRRKVYPAIAYDELFRPAALGENPFTPIMSSSRNIARAESFIVELVCSEMFAFNGPMNHETIAANIRNIERRLGINSINLSNAIEIISRQTSELAKWTMYGQQSNYRPRRTVMLLPCVTNRATDYHIFGTNLHLAAGLNIVFCNSSLGGFGNGGSCLIGYRAWDERPSKNKSGPYHGEMPGLYVPVDGGRISPLGPRERALVIVDIDPIDPAMPNPRPQYRADPVRLVAHMPIVEMAEPSFADWKHVKSMAQIDDIVERASTLVGSVPASASDSDALNSGDITSTAHLTQSRWDEIRRDTAALLREIATKLAPESEALGRRAKAFEQHFGGHPEAWPPPVLTDWLVVDLRLAEFKTDIENLKELRRPEEGGHLPLIWIKPPRMEGQ
jgi:DNA primase catalytic core